MFFKWRDLFPELGLAIVFMAGYMLWAFFIRPTYWPLGVWIVLCIAYGIRKKCFTKLPEYTKWF